MRKTPGIIAATILKMLFVFTALFLTVFLVKQGDFTYALMSILLLLLISLFFIKRTGFKLRGMPLGRRGILYSYASFILLALLLLAAVIFTARTRF